MTHEKRRKRLWVSLIAVGLVIVLAVAGYLIFFRSDTEPASEPNPWTKSVDETGGSFSFPNGLTIDVPQDAVSDDAALMATEAELVTDSESGPLAGLRSGAVTFDISLIQDGEEIQPLQPLRASIPLEGSFLPEGSEPAVPLLYSEVAENQTLLMPTKKNDTGLEIDLYHLSPKYLAYLNPTAFLEAFGLGEAEVTRPEDCKSKVEVSGVEVELTADGWSNDDEDSPIGACLSVDDGELYLGVANWVSHILSVNTSDGLEFDVALDNVEEELVEFFAETIFPHNADAYVGRDGRLVAALSVDNLPATVALSADSTIFLSEVGWFGFKAAVTILTGGVGAVVLQQALQAIEVVSCIQTAFDLSDDELENFNLLQAVNLLTSNCTEIILEAMGFNTGWGLFQRWFSAIGLVAEGIELVATGFENVRMQAIGTMTVEVSQVAPDCISEWEANELFLRALAERGDSSVDLDNLNEEIEYQLENYPLEIICTDDWATAKLTAGGDGIHLYKWNGSNWEILGWGSYWPGDHPDLCADPAMPQAVFDRLYC